MIKFAELEKGPERPFSVIPAKVGIQRLPVVTGSLDSGFHRGDAFLWDNWTCFPQEFLLFFSRLHFFYLKPKRRES
jgi:hypothetical protein